MQTENTAFRSRYRLLVNKGAVRIRNKVLALVLFPLGAFGKHHLSKPGCDPLTNLMDLDSTGSAH
jgi:hypothetical protein